MNDDQEENKKSSFKCSVCNKLFANHQNRRRHEVKVHEVNILRKNSKLNCSECDKIFSCSKEYCGHFSHIHTDIILKDECLNFDSEDDFLNWKSNFCKSTSSDYVLRSRYRTSESEVKVFHCHRSGIFNSASTGKRRLKCGGSNKTGFYCPAKMKVLIWNSGQVKANVQTTHVGHRCEIEKLRVTKSENDELVINDTFQDEKDERLQDEIVTVPKKSKRKKSSIRDYYSKREAEEALLEFIPVINQCTSNDQFQDIIQTITALKHRCEATATTSSS